MLWSTFFFFSLMPRARAPITGFFVTITLVVALGGLTVMLYVASIFLNLDSSLTGKNTKRGLVTTETLVLRRWGSEALNFNP